MNVNLTLLLSFSATLETIDGTFAGRNGGGTFFCDEKKWTDKTKHLFYSAEAKRGAVLMHIKVSSFFFPFPSSTSLANSQQSDLATLRFLSPSRSSSRSSNPPPSPPPLPLPRRTPKGKVELLLRKSLISLDPKPRTRTVNLFLFRNLNQRRCRTGRERRRRWLYLKLWPRREFQVGSTWGVITLLPALGGICR